MNGTSLTLGLVGALALAATVRRGSLNRLVLSGDLGALAKYESLVGLAPSLMASIESELSDSEDLEDDAAFLMADLLRDKGMDVIGVGGHRVVVRLGKAFVAKVAALHDGVEQNRHEYETWGRASLHHPKISALLVPVHDLSAEGAVLLTEISKPCDLATGSDLQRCRDAMRRAEKLLASSPLTKNIDDVHHEINWGIHGGSVKLIDYGR